MDIFQQDKDGVIIRVKVVPRSSKNGIAGALNDVIKVNLTAPPVDGAANEALQETLARLCGLRKSDVVIICGQTSRHKRVRLVGANLDNVKKSLGF